MTKGTRTKVDFYLQMIREKCEGEDCVYRGQSCNFWQLNDGAKRRIRKSGHVGDVPPERLKSYHSGLLRKADKKGFRFHNDRYLTELELLAQLQHFKAATLLLDFSEKALVALYFACQRCSNKNCDNEKCQHDVCECVNCTCKECEDSDGRIFIVPYRVIDEIKTDTPISDIITSPNHLRWHPVLHGPAERRMIAQSGLFLMNLPENWSKFQDIKREDKEEVLQELKELHHISAETLFMDIAGFAEDQAHTSDLDEGWVWFKKGNRYFQEGDFTNAIECYKHAIRLSPYLVEAHCNLGIIYMKSENYDRALEKFETSIKIDPYFGVAHAMCGSVLVETGEFNLGVESIKRGLDIANKQSNKVLVARINEAMEALQSKYPKFREFAAERGIDDND